MFIGALITSNLHKYRRFQIRVRARGIVVKREFQLNFFLVDSLHSAFGSHKGVVLTKKKKIFQSTSRQMPAFLTHQKATVFFLSPVELPGANFFPYLCRFKVVYT